MIRVKKGWKNWYAIAVVFLSLGLSVPAGAISTDHSHGGHDSGNAAVDRPNWLKKRVLTNAERQCESAPSGSLGKR